MSENESRVSNVLGKLSAVPDEILGLAIMGGVAYAGYWAFQCYEKEGALTKETLTKCLFKSTVDVALDVDDEGDKMILKPIEKGLKKLPIPPDLSNPGFTGLRYGHDLYQAGRHPTETWKSIKHDVTHPPGFKDVGKAISRMPGKTYDNAKSFVNKTTNLDKQAYHSAKKIFKKIF